MSNEVAAAAEVIRLVRCPKCGEVLPENANIPVYQCGSCHTTLQAKSRGGSRKPSEINGTHSTRLQSEFPNVNSVEGPKALAEEEPSCVEACTGNAQQLHKDEFDSHQESKQNGASQLYYSDDKYERSTGGRSCEEINEGRVSPGGQEKEIDSAQSLELAPDERGHRSADAQNSRQTLGMSNKQKPLYDPCYERREVRTRAEERSDGSSGSLFHSGSTSSGEILHRPRPSQGTYSPHSVSPRKRISNPMFRNSLPHRSDTSDRGSVKPSWASREHLEVNGMETRANGGRLTEELVGAVQSNGKNMRRQVDDLRAGYDCSNELETELEDQRMLNAFELQSRARNMNTAWSRNQIKSTQIDPRFQRREMNIEWQKHSHYKLHSQARDRSLESNPGFRNTNSLQNTHSIQASLLQQQRTPPTRVRHPYLSSNMPLEAERSDLNMFSEGLKQLNQNYDNEDFDYIGNIPQVDETEFQILQKRKELLQKLDELRAQLSKSCQLPYSLNLQSQHKIVGATPKPRQGMVERDRYKNNGHGSVFIPIGDDAESISWDDYSDGSMQSSGQLPYVSQIQCVPREGQVQTHIEREPLPGMMEKEYIENGFASNTQDYGHRRSTIHPHRITRVSRSGEMGLSHPHRTSHVSQPSVNTEQHPCSCSSHFLQHQGGCCSHSYQDKHPLHVPLNFSPSVCCHQQVHNATNHIYFHSSNPTSVQVQATLSHQLPHMYHESVDVQRSKAKESELILHKEKKCAEEPVVVKQRNLPYLPFAGGAPFVLCDSCLQLLLIPRNLSSATKKKHKLRCGTCSSVFEFTIRSWRQFEFINTTKHTDYPRKYTQEPPCEFHDARNLAHNHATGTSSSIENNFINERNFRDTSHSHIDDYDAPISTSHSANCKQDFLPLVPTDQNTVLKSHSLSRNVPLSMARVDERCQDYSVQRVKGQDCDSLQNDFHDLRNSEARDISSKAEGSSELDIASPVVGSPLHELFGYSSPLEMINKCGPEKTNVARYKRRVESGKPNHPENAYVLSHPKMANKPVVSVSLSDMHPGSGNSIKMTGREHQEDLSRESGRSWNISIKGFLKKGIKDLKKGNQGLESFRSNVSVNGRSIPDTLVKKAEEYAGPIQPGCYWYDYQAGFWGLMGEPCLGIIPPFIEEFHYPMPRDCAGGKTRILVNGRELHQKDLDLLAARGLPTTKDKSYHVEISGRVVDKATNTELKTLGKLAPTLEKIGRGYGMRAPRKRS